MSTFGAWRRQDKKSPRKNMYTCCINEETLPLETTISCIKSWVSDSNIRRATLEMPSTEAEEIRYSSEAQAFNLFAQKVSPSWTSGHPIMSINSKYCIAAGLLYLLLFTCSVHSAATPPCFGPCSNWQTNTTAKMVYSGLQMMSEMKWTLTQQPTTNVSVMAMTVA